MYICVFDYLPLLIPTTSSLLVTVKFVFWVCESILFCNKFICIIFEDSLYGSFLQLWLYEVFSASL